MSLRGPLFALVAAMPFALLGVLNTLTACHNPTDCISRGTSTTYSGSATYTGQTNGPRRTSLSGASPVDIVVYDANGSCSYSAMEFLVTVAGCSLWVQSDGEDSGEGGPTAMAAVESGQSCALPLASGTVIMTIDNGSLVVDSTTQLTLTGSVTATVSGVEMPGYLQWSFSGD